MALFKQVFIGLSLTLGLSAQAQDAVLMTVDNKPVYKTEFESIFKKNSKDQKITKASLDEYIDLFVKFKLKVTEAERLGLDTVKGFINELQGYRKQLAKPYLTDNQLTDELLKEAYERMLTEVRASHILIKCTSDFSPADTLKAYRKAEDIRKRLLAGEDFKVLASTSSDDPSAQQNYGDLGYFTGLAMVYPFETAAFNTPVGKISDIVKTSFGYHILKVVDKRKARGEVKVAHILLQVSEPSTVETKQTIKNKIYEIYGLLKQGEDFTELAKKYSEDKSSADKGGVLQAFTTGRMVEEFEEASFNLTSDNAFSLPFQTAYGWHIVKLIEKKPIKSFEEFKPELTRRISRDDRSRLTKQSFVAKLKKEYNVVVNKDNLKPFYKYVDTTFFAGNWKRPSDKLLSKNIAMGKDFVLSQKDFADYLSAYNSDVVIKEDAKTFVDKYFESFLENRLLEFEDSKLESKYPEFKALVKEYRDGILLFDLTNKMVWNKAVEDTSGLKEFYEAHKADYQWKQRANFELYRAKDKKLAEAALKLVKKGLPEDSVLKKVNQSSQLNLSAESGLIEQGTNPILDQFEWKLGLSEIKSIGGQFVFVKINELLAPQSKKIEEAKGIITAAYQNYLEEQWLKSLKDRYKVEVKNEVLYSVQ